MSYTVKIKEEISLKKNTKSELIAELSGYFRNNGIISDNTMITTTENKFSVDRLKQALNDIYQIDSKIETIENLNFSKRDLYQLSFLVDDNIVLKDLGIVDFDGSYLETVPDYIVGANEEIRAYLRGVFCADGSISDPKKSRYHMEILVLKPAEAVFVQKLLNIFDLNAKVLNREKGYMIYIKEAEKISDFLKIIGANKAVLYYENVRIYRDKKNITNRLNNCEQANMDKVIQTANTQLKEIEIIEKNDGLMLLDDKVREVIKYRKKYPEVSLKELAEIISLETNRPITKSGLSHRLRKIRDLAEKIQDAAKEKSTENN